MAGQVELTISTCSGGPFISGSL